ncbi:glucokinase [Methylicorpusculum oleiharenae]|uniref:glucokinase n=1 Tax=Methylicorpusculum oleiharenae TaxID=1338687 RepID=UPI001359B62E|nr:glucokinase [Methylicorpusculum oleiharenae]MCD2450917.1 glucokinase [Methylicorpusculum oleiharenae]
MILAGDIGGTKTVLSLFKKEAGGSLVCEREETYASADFQEFDELLAAFLPDGVALSAVCFGVAGPVLDQRCHPTNLPWILDAEDLKVKLNVAKVRILNDLEAMALGMLHLPEKDLLELNPNAQSHAGNIAVIAAGTGLGEAILYWDGVKYHPLATEGGHCDFAAQNTQQDLLLSYMRRKYNDHVSCERLISGIGFSHLYDFLREQQFAPECPAVPPVNALYNEGVDRNAIISRLGVNGEDALCAEAVRLFAELYGAEAGNLVLKSFAIGGVYIGGGIGPKIRPLLQNGVFMDAFKAKGRFTALLDKVPVKLSLNPKTPLLGALHYFDV